MGSDWFQRCKPFLPQEFGILDTPGSQMQQGTSGLLGMINSGPYIACCLLGCWLTDPLNHYLGRRGTLFFCGIFCIFSVIGQGLAQTWPQLFCVPFTSRSRNGPKGYDFPCFRCRKCTCYY
ncbi:hypothetical protein BDQ17DRAFT_200410 [Cyathus striatus]|nr:hypothetical protein BDQ17DRAFT_200410 [Cyathus striatus]